MPGEIVMYDPLVVPVVMVLAGFALAFHGRKLVPLALVIVSLAAGFLYGGGIVLSFTDNSDIIRWAPVILGIAAAVLVSVLYRLFFFAAGAILGFVLVHLIFPESSLVFGILGAFLCGGLVYLFRNLVFSVLTALFGGILLASGSVNLLGWIRISADNTAYILILTGTCIWGFIHQMRKGRKS